MPEPLDENPGKEIFCNKKGTAKNKIAPKIRKIIINEIATFKKRLTIDD